MSERDGTAVDVELLLRNAQLAAHALDATEGLVDLEEIHRVHRPARALEHARDGTARGEQEQLGLTRVLTLRDHARQRRRTQLPRALVRRDDQGGRAVVQLRRVPGGDRAAGLERPRALRHRLQARLARRLVLRDGRDRALLSGDIDGHDLFVEGSALLRLQRLLVAAYREPILIIARERAALRGLLAAATHVTA